MKVSDWAAIGFVAVALGVAFAPILPVVVAYLGIAIIAVWIGGS